MRKYSFSFLSLMLLFHIILVTAAGAVNKIMPLGDSITQGTSSGVADPDFQVSYRKALYDKLWAAGYVVDDEIFVGTLISGESVADFDPDHEGHPGWRANEIVAGRTGFEAQGKLDEWLNAEEPNIVLLHIGTNDVANGDEDWNEIEDILDVIDDYEFTTGKPVWVILALIIDRSCDPFMPPCFKSPETTAFNNNVRDFVFFPRQAGGDKIILVDMQNGAGINYDRWDMGGDMWDNLHPFETGFSKMADLWFSGLMDILPQADAGDTQNVNETALVTLDGKNSTDADGTIVSYLWEQTDGPVVTDLTGAATDTATFTAPFVAAAGATLIFRLTVTDNDGLVSSDTVDVIVVDSPVANAGVDQDVAEGATVNLDGTGSTGRNITFAWTQTKGTQAINFTGGSTATPSFTAPDINTPSETLTFQLTVTDDLGTISSNAVDVIVVDSPVANAGVDQDVAEGNLVTLVGSGSTGRNITFAWTPSSGTGWALSDATAESPTFTAPDVATAVETLTFQLTVTDDVGATSTPDTVDVNVADASVSPVADAGPDQNVTVGATVTLDGMGSTGTGLTYAWAQGPVGTRVQLAGANTATPTFTAPDASAVAAALLETLTFELTVTDNANRTSTATTNVNVDDGTTASSGGGGGGGGGCFINSMR